MIEKGNVVSVHYTGRFENGEVFDSSIGREPLKFQFGSGQLITGFEEAILGKSVGDKVSINITPDKSYGKIREDLIVKVKHDQMPGKVEVGQTLQAQASNGQEINVTVTEITDDYVMIDANHPLAGKNLIFEIEVLEIEKNPS